MISLHKWCALTDVVSLCVPCSPVVLLHVVQKIKTDVPKDISLAEAGKYSSLTDFAFFDKVSLLVS